MRADWQPTRLKKVLRQVRRLETVQPTKAYDLLGVRLEGAGPYLRETKTGDQISANQLAQVAAGDFIYSRLFAWRGAFGTIGQDLDGAFVSGEFPTFVADTEKVDIEFLKLWFLLPATIQVVESLSSGSTPLTRNRFKEHHFLDLEILLPPLAEQQRIVVRIEALTARIEEAKGLRAQAVAEVEAIGRTILFDKRIDTSLTPLRELVELRQTDVTVEPDTLYQFAGVYCFGRGVFRSTAKRGSEFSYSRLTRLNANDFVFPKLMAWEGAFGIVPQQSEGSVVSPEFPVFSVNCKRILPEVLDCYFKTPAVWPVVSGISTGTNVRRRRLHPSRFLDFRFPLPPMSTQIKLREMNHQLEPIRRLQAETQAELVALLPSVLDRAFRGEL